MIPIVNKENDRNNELSRRIDADLRVKMSGSSKTVSKNADPDFTEGAEYIKDLKKTGKFGWVWIVLVGLVLVILIALGLSLNQK